MTTPITVAHLTDVHLGPIAGFGPRYWNLKRLAGYINWRRHRRGAYQKSVLDRIVADMQAQAPAHVVVTGDLANIGLPQEHINALGWLRSIGDPDNVTVVPGNHDIYSRVGADPGTHRWAQYMSSCAEGAAYCGGGADFPFVRLQGRVALIGVNSAVPTPPLIAWGRVGRDQLSRLAGILDRLGSEGIFRFVLIHHPPLPGQADTARGLRDARALEAVLARHGAELVSHGHNHEDTLVWCRTAGASVPVVGAASGSLGRHYKSEPLARYNLYRIDGPPWRIELVGRGLAEPGGPVVELERRILAEA
ncbi:MAG: metallophosphoesterase [Hyphomicrobiaceae bacterium]|nr:MAG: metallophosphoesterase [Hyphomicrobiaceae bacterium]